LHRSSLARLCVAEIVKLFGEALRAQGANHGSKETKCVHRSKEAPCKSAHTMGSRYEKERILGIGQSAAKPPTGRYVVRGGRFNDCKAYHASGIYSLVPRETVPGEVGSLPPHQGILRYCRGLLGDGKARANACWILVATLDRRETG
jgi:hypothetical protein